MSPLDQNVPFMWDFSRALPSGDIIASVVNVTSFPAGLTIGQTAIVAGVGGPALAVQAPLGGGVAGTQYTCTATILSVDGETISRSFVLPVQAR
jgi:hypothetical protein